MIKPISSAETALDDVAQAMVDPKVLLDVAATHLLESIGHEPVPDALSSLAKRLTTVLREKTDKTVCDAN